MVPFRYHTLVDVNVKGLEPDLVARLAAQAAAEGMSQQEWIRAVLRQTALRPSPAELVAQRAALTPMSEADFAVLRARVGARRRTATQRLDAPGSGR